MPTINFPSSPFVGQTYSFNGRTWVWNSYAWDVSTASGGGGGGAGGAQYLFELNDVTVIDPYEGQGLVYNGTTWENQGIVNSVNMSTGDITVLSDIPTPIVGVNFNASYGNIINLNSIIPNSSLTIDGDLIVTGSIYALNPYQVIQGDTQDTIPDSIDGGTFS